MRSCAITALALALSGCTTFQGLRTMQVAAEATCATGAALDAAGEPAGGVIEAAACWLADYAAKRIERLESQQEESASVAEVERDAVRDDAADALGDALAMCDPDAPTQDQEAAVARAWAKCRSLAPD